MKKGLLALIPLIVLLLMLTTIPVAANTEPDVVLHGSGQVIYPGDVLVNVTIAVDTRTDFFRGTVIALGDAVTPEGDPVTGYYVVGEVTDWEVNGNEVTVWLLFDAYMLIKGQPPQLWEEGATEVISALVTGPGNRCEIFLSEGGSIKGTAVIR
jgi:hypothetical protein